MRKPPVRPKDNNATLFCGLDLSLTGTGIIVMTHQGIVVHRAVLKNKLRDMYRLAAIRSMVAAVYAKHNIHFTCVEGYAMGSRSGQAFSIGELGGVIKLFLHQRGFKYHPVPPTQAKKFATGKGTSAKDEVMMAVYKNWKFESKDNNEADAYVLAQIARCIKTQQPLKKTQADTIIQIRKDLNAK